MLLLLRAPSSLPPAPSSVLSLPHPQITDLASTLVQATVEHVGIGSAVALSLIVNDQLYTWYIFSLAHSQINKYLYIEKESL